MSSVRTAIGILSLLANPSKHRWHTTVRPPAQRLAQGCQTAGDRVVGQAITHTHTQAAHQRRIDRKGEGETLTVFGVKRLRICSFSLSDKLDCARNFGLRLAASPVPTCTRRPATSSIKPRSPFSPSL